MVKSEHSNTLEGRSIICFASGPWDSMWRNRHQIMSRLAKTNKVLYIEPQIQGIRQALVAFKKSIKNKNPQGESLKHIDNDLWVYRYPRWTFRSNRFILNLLGVMLHVFAISRAAHKLKMKAPIIWVVEPRFGDMIKYLNKSLICYHVVDNYAASPYYPSTIRKELEKTDKIMLSIADLVIVTSPFLFNEKSKNHKNVHLVRNAADYEQFAPSKHLRHIPRDMEHIPKPIIGHVGVVNEKLNFELLDAIARQRPQWSFVFIGHYYNSSLPEYHSFVNNHPPNVFMLGRRDVKEVPHYIHACNVCILPYCQNEYTEAIDSLKLYEYFACEKPVVATDIPAVRDYKQLVYIANNADDFIAKIQAALTSFTAEQREAQKAIAMQNTWDKRVEQISAILNSALAKK